MFLAEANQWPEDAVAYFGNGDECHTAFHFPLMPRMFMAIRTEDRFPIIDILEQTPAIPDTCQWCLFLRNHDELTLEMVTDEERDYMYRAYAADTQARINLGIRRRLAPLLGNNRRRIELMNGLLFSLPGTPVLYYGDEIGMGDNIYLGDRNGVRTPMQWSGDRNAGLQPGQPAEALPAGHHRPGVPLRGDQRRGPAEQPELAAVVDEAAHRPCASGYKAFGRGIIEFLFPENPKILAFVRRYEDETILVVANLSRFTQHAELHLEAFQGLVPLELFGRVEFPVIGKDPYPVMLGPHGFGWFALQPQRPAVLGLTDHADRVPGDRRAGRVGPAAPRTVAKAALEAILPTFLTQRRWFGGKNRQDPRGRDPGGRADPRRRHHRLLSRGLTCSTWRPTRRCTSCRWPRPTGPRPSGSWRHCRMPSSPGSRATGRRSSTTPCGTRRSAPPCSRRWPAARRSRGPSGKLAAVGLSTLAEELGGYAARTDPQQGRAEQHVDHLRRPVHHEGVPPGGERREPGPGDRPVPLRDAAVPAQPAGRRVPGIPPPARREPMTLALLQRFVPNQGTGWTYTLDALGQYLERVLTAEGGVRPPPELRRARSPTWRGTSRARRRGGDDRARTWNRSACSGSGRPRCTSPWRPRRTDPAFSPEPFSPMYQRSIYQSMRSEASRVFQTLAKRIKTAARRRRRNSAQQVLDAQADVLARFQAVTSTRDDRPAVPAPRRLPPRAGALHRQGLRHHRLRGRAARGR